jgi:hypothetical protein
MIRGSAVAVVVTLSKGYDLEYVWRHMTPGLTPGRTGYYIGAAAVYGELLAADLGADRDRKLELRAEAARRSVHGQLVAAEPHATAERKQELADGRSQGTAGGP